MFVIGCCVSKAFAAGELSFEGISRTPLSRVVPGGVLNLEANINNPGDSVGEGTIVVSIEELPKLQSARRVVLKPGQQERLDLLVQIPESIQDFKLLHITATMLVRYGEREVILERNGSPVRHEMTLKVGEGQSIATAMQPEPLSLPEWYWPKVLPRTDYEFAIAARIEAGYDRTAATLGERPLPLNDSNWAGLDSFVISDARVLEDGAVLESLRRYVATGGRLWIMLDLVPSALVRPLLGPEQLCEEVDRVELNDFFVEPIGSAIQLSEQDRRVTSETDLTMARVVHQGGRVRFEVGGWPIAIEMNVGYGRLVLTTLDSRAWIEPRTNKTEKDPMFLSTYQPRVWAKVFAIDSNEPRPSLPLTELVDYPLQQIGNPIVPRGWVAVVLLGFFLCLAGFSAWFAYLGKQTLIGLVTPLAAIVISLSVIAASNWIRRDIPESVSRFQIVEVGADGNFASVREQSTVFLASTTSMQLNSMRDGSVQISEAVTSGVSRNVQEDFQKWNVSNEAWPPGLWRYELQATLPTENLVVRGVLSKAGLHLQMPDNLPSSLEDAVLGFIPGDPMLCEPVDRGFHVNNSIHIGSDRWIAGAFLSNEQERRIELYRQFFDANHQRPLPTRRLYGWSQPWNGASWNRELKQLGSALVALPIALDRPPPGTEISVPHGLIRLQRDTTVANITSTFDDRSGKWRESNATGTEAEMQFVLPQEVVPIAASAIDLKLDVTAPQRDVVVSVRTRSGVVELVKLDSPSIPWTATISNPAVLEAAKDGTLNVLIQVSQSRNTDSNGIASNMVHWQIDHFHASVRGTVLEQSSLSSKTIGH